MANINTGNLVSALKTKLKSSGETVTLNINDTEAVKAIKYDGSTFYPDSNGIANLENDKVDLLKSYNFLTKCVKEYGTALPTTSEVNETTILAVKENDDNYSEDYEDDNPFPTKYDGSKYSLFICTKDDDEKYRYHRISAPLIKSETMDIDFFSSKFNTFPNFINYTLMNTYVENKRTSYTLSDDEGATTYTIDKGILIDYVMSSDTTGNYRFYPYIVYKDSDKYYKKYIKKIISKKNDDDTVIYIYIVDTDTIVSVDIEDPISSDMENFAKNIHNPGAN